MNLSHSEAASKLALKRADRIDRIITDLWVVSNEDANRMHARLVLVGYVLSGIVGSTPERGLSPWACMARVATLAGQVKRLAPWRLSAERVTLWQVLMLLNAMGRKTLAGWPDQTIGCEENCYQPDLTPGNSVA